MNEVGNIDWSLKVNIKYVVNASYERVWQEEEMLVIAEQLLALEDDDPIALPGTEREWRDYRIKVRSWKDGNPDFPEPDKRPQRPTGK